MNYKKILILLILFVAVAGLAINVVSAVTYEGKCYGGDRNHQAKWTKTFIEKVYYDEIVKKNEEYYKKIGYLYEYSQHSCFHESHENDWSWEDPDGYRYDSQTVSDPSRTGQEKYDLVKVKKGDVIKKSEAKYWKTIESKGKVQKVYKFTKTVAVSSKQLKKVSATSKKTVGYYKTFKMPTFSQGKYKWGSFKGNSFTYGNSYVGYYVKHLNDYNYYNSDHRVYKITPKTTNLLGSNVFNKKPTSFKLYAYA